MARTDIRIAGTIRNRRTKQGLHSLRIEIWDHKIQGHDIIGAAETDRDGRYSITFDEDHLTDLGLSRSPSVFAKIFDRHRLLVSGERSRPRKLRNGTNQFNITLDHIERLNWTDLFELVMTRPTPVLDGPGGKELCVLETGDIAVAAAVDELGFDVRLGNGGSGWIALDDLDDIRDRMQDYLSDDTDVSVLPVAAKQSLTEFDDGTNALECMLNDVGLMDDLAFEAGPLKRNEIGPMLRFDVMLDLLIDRFQPPPRPDNFTLLAIRHEMDGLGGRLVVPNLNRTFRLPCLLSLRALHRIGTGIFRSAWRLGIGSPADISDRLWQGFHVLGRLIDAGNTAGALFHQIDRGNGGFARKMLASAGCFNAGVIGAFDSRLPVSGQVPSFFSDWEPGRFPGFFRPRPFDCRVEQWERSARAVRCCGQTYRIDDISGERCPGEIITITGWGFSHVRPTQDPDTGEDIYPPGLDPRIWPFPHTPAIPGGGPPGPFENVVLFPAADGGQIVATEYPEWLFDRVQVVIPDGAVSGAIEMRIICDETFHGRPTDLDRCGIETRLPAHRPSNALLDLDTGTLTVRAIDMDSGSGRSVTVSVADEPARLEVGAEGCTDLNVNVSGTNLRELTLAFSDGTSIPFRQGSAGATRDIPDVFAVPVFGPDGETQRVTVTGRDGCDRLLTVNLIIFRRLLVKLDVARGPHDPRTTTSVPVMTEVSCNPQEIPDWERDLPVRLLLRAPVRAPAGISVSPSSFDLPDAGPATSEITFAGPFVDCGAVTIEGSVPTSGSRRPPGHVDGTAEIVVRTGAFSANITGSGRFDIRAPAGRTLPDEISPPFGIGGLSTTLFFDAFGDAAAPNSVVRVSDISASLGDGIDLRQTGGGTGTYNCIDNSLEILIDIEIGFPFGSISMSPVFTTGATMSGPFTATGRPVSPDGSVRLAAAGVLSGSGSGGGVDGFDALITLEGTITPV